MKKRIKTLTVIILLAVSIASSAQKSILINDLHPLLLNYSEVQNEIILSSEFTISGTRLYAEEKLELEEWMLAPDNLLNAPLSEGMYANLDKSSEADIYLEDWMLSSSSPPVSNTFEFLKVDIEAPLKLEDWMINKDFWYSEK